MADSSEFRGMTEVGAAERVSGKEFLSSATERQNSDRMSFELVDMKARGGQLPRRSNASHAIVVLARARTLRLRQAETRR